MSELTTKLHVKQSDTIYEVTLYETAEEATPTDGNFWELSYNGVQCYAALVNRNIADNDLSNHCTPLIVKKNNVEYYLDTYADISNGKKRLTIIPPSFGGTVFVNGKTGTEFEFDSDTEAILITAITDDGYEVCEIGEYND